MAGGANTKSSSHRHPSAASSSSFSNHRKSRWEFSNSTPNHHSNHPQKPKLPTPTNPQSNNNVKNPKLPNNNAQSATTATPKNPNPRMPNPNPIPIPNPIPPPSASSSSPFPFPGLAPPPPPPSYGFHMLDRRTIALADGSVRSYFALPPDYHDFPPRSLPPPLPFPGPSIRFPPMSPDGLPFRGNDPNFIQNLSLKRKFGGIDDEFMFHKGFRPMGPGPEFRGGGGGDFRAGSSNSPFARGRGEEMRAGKVMRVENGQVDKQKLKKAFLRFVRLINDSEGERLRYLENGKRNKQLQCLACHRSSKELSDMHALIMHTYYSDNAELIVDHLGLHKALCVLMGWNYSKPPDDSKAYQFLPADEAAANQDDLIIWPPVVLIHNTISGKREDGRLDGLKNKAMDSRIRELGIMGGKSNKLFNREGYTGMSIIRFLGDQAGLKEALKLADHFEKENCGRQAWARIQPVTLGKDDENNPNLVKTDRTGEKTRIWYGYLGTASDLHKIDYEARKKLDIESLQDRRASK